MTGSCKFGLVCVMVVLGALLNSPAPLHAALTQVHVSLEDYYAGGTAVDVTLDNFGNNDFTVGNTSGTILWQVTEKVWWDDTANQTIVSYTTYNDAFASNITSVHIPVPSGIAAASVIAPTGWTGGQAGNEISWQTPGPGIPMFQSLDTMIVQYPGLLNVVFQPVAKVDLADGSLLANSTWVVSTVPEPVTLALLALGGLATLRRRRS
jgi:hypothetical protein